MTSANYNFNEGDAILPYDAMEYFILALVGVGVVVLLMLVNPWTAILLMCAVGLVDLYLFGEWCFLVPGVLETLYLKHNMQLMFCICTVPK
jgi:hypothetical protein